MILLYLKLYCVSLGTTFLDRADVNYHGRSVGHRVPIYNINWIYKKSLLPSIFWSITGDGGSMIHTRSGIDKAVE